MASYFGRFRTVYNQDLSTLSNQIFIANQAYSWSDGSVANKINTANEISTTTSGSFTQPAIGGSTTVTVTSATGFANNDYVYIANGGLYQATTAGSTMTILRIADANVASPVATGGSVTSGKTFTRCQAIVNGTGLVFQPGSTSDYNGSTRTFPGLWLPFNTITSSLLATPLASLGWCSRIRLWANLTSDNSAANYDSLILGVDNAASTWAAFAKRGYIVGGIGVAGGAGVSPSSSAVGAVGYTLGTGNRVLMVDIDLARISIAMFSGTNANMPTWPTEDVMNLSAFHAPATSSAPSAGLGTPASTLGVIIGGQRAASGTAFKAVVKHLRIDVMPLAA